MEHRLYATCARGIESLLADELRALGARDVRPARAGVSFAGDTRIAYAACLWSRTGSRILLSLGKARADSVDSLYEDVWALPWEDHLSPDGTLAVDFASDANPAFRNTMFGAQKVKDAIVDRLREQFGRRPSVDPVAPDVRVNVRVRTGVATVSLDLAGDALHRRGYREPGVQGAAPLKESLAAAMLLLSGWREIAATSGALVDPMCGSGTLLIEGAWIAGDVAPGSLRARWGFTGWLGHDEDAWAELLADADARAEAGLAALPSIAGTDSDPGAVELALANIARAGLRGRVGVAAGRAQDALPHGGSPAGLVAVNPPYGERLGERSALADTYRDLGVQLRVAFPGWRVAVLTDDDALATAVGLVPDETHRLFNGAIPVRLDVSAVPTRSGDVTAGSAAFENRVRKNLRHLSKWAKRDGIAAWRVYDADLPDFAVSVDIYDCQDGVRRAVVAEYEAPREIDAVKAAVRLREAVAALPAVLDVDASEVRLKTRKRQRGEEAQYERIAATGRFHVVREGAARFLVNLDDYLDTGLFLDHRLTREMVATLAVGKSLCNLFCYTGAVTVQAALAGASATTSVDLSKTYLDWAGRNLAENGLADGPHGLVRADATRWMAEVAADPSGLRFGVVFLDPPSFSTSKAMEDTLDVQRDHVRLIRDAVGLLEAGGALVFSTNLRTFKLGVDGLAAEGLTAEDVSAATIPPDFARNPRIHRCFVVRR